MTNRLSALCSTLAVHHTLRPVCTLHKQALLLSDTSTFIESYREITENREIIIGVVVIINRLCFSSFPTEAIVKKGRREFEKDFFISTFTPHIHTLELSGHIAATGIFNAF